MVLRDDGKYDLTIKCKGLKLYRKKQGSVLSLVSIAGWLPVEVMLGDVVFKPKIVLKIERRITEKDKLRLNREWVRSRLKSPALI